MNGAQADRLRNVLLDPVEAALIEIDGTRAAVLVPLYERGDELVAVLTRRREDLRAHAGQISFPGGRLDFEDEPLVTAALREAAEEIGLAREAVTVLGALTPIGVPASGFALYPFVGAIAGPPEWTPSAHEVDAVLEPTLAELVASHARRTIRRFGAEIETDTFLAEPDLIWGATARVIVDLLTRMGLL